MKILLLYVAVLFGVFLEGEMVMLSSVIAAFRGYLELWIVVVIGMFGTFSSDCLYFFLGRKKGKVWIEKRTKLKNKANYIHDKIERYPVLIFIIYRFAYGLRTLTPIVIGTSEIKASRFLAYSFGSIILWAAFYTTIGYLFGGFIESHLSEIKHIEKYIMGTLVIGGLCFAAYHYVKYRRLQKLASR